MEGLPTFKEIREAVREGKIIGFKCRKCGHKSVTPMVYCFKCGGKDIERVELPSTGKVLTYTIQMVAPEQFINEVPYAWVIVELDDGTRVSGWIPFIDKPKDLPIGQRVKMVKTYKPGIVFEKVTG